MFIKEAKELKIGDFFSATLKSKKPCAIVDGKVISGKLRKIEKIETATSRMGVQQLFFIDQDGEKFNCLDTDFPTVNGRVVNAQGIFSKAFRLSKNGWPVE